MSNSVQPHGLWSTRLLCPWNSLGKITGVGCHALLQRIFLTQELNPRLLYLLHWQVGSLLPGKVHIYLEVELLGYVIPYIQHFQDYNKSYEQVK